MKIEVKVKKINGQTCKCSSNSTKIITAELGLSSSIAFCCNKVRCIREARKEVKENVLMMQGIVESTEDWCPKILVVTEPMFKTL